MLSGGILIDKPAGPTSHDVVGRLRRLAGQRQVGHTGTLDPMATGLMVCVLGRATKLSPYLTHMEKRYDCVARLGTETDTYDAEGRVVRESEAIPSDSRIVEETMSAFVGGIDQRPPVYSAIKVKGKRLHRYARSGENVEVPTRRIRIEALDLRSYEPPDLRFICRVSAGAYVRSLCHDIGQALGCGAHMTALRRLSVGPFDVEDAARLDELQAGRDTLPQRLLGAEALLPHLPRLVASGEAARKIVNGNTCESAGFEPAPTRELACQPVLVCDRDGAALAIVEVLESERPAWAAGLGQDVTVLVKPRRVLARGL